MSVPNWRTVEKVIIGWDRPRNGNHPTILHCFMVLGGWVECKPILVITYAKAYQLIPATAPAV